MKKFIIYIGITAGIILSGCEDRLTEINVNPNDPLDAGATQLLLGTQLANISINASHLQRISGMWSGQYEGITLLYQSLHQYNMSSEETESTWGYVYQGVVKQSRVIQDKLTGATDADVIILSIARIMEAYAVGTAAETFGDIPYREAAGEIEDPAFDPQAQVFADLQLLLADVITELGTVTTSPLIKQDIFFAGNATKWTQVARTLRARYYMDVKDYPNAYIQAQSGISTDANSLTFAPPAAPTQNQNANLLWTFIRERAGYMRSTNTHMATLLGASGATRRNAKTNEDARSKYLSFTGSGNPSTGVARTTAPMKLVSFAENTLILAEAGARTVDLATGLGHLNTWRTHLASGNDFVKVAGGDILLYTSYVASDFDPAGIENVSGSLTPIRALLREIIEEKYVSCVGTFVPFNDARRLRKSDTDIDVDFSLNFGTKYPERMLYPQSELNSNSKAPTSVPDIFQVTPVNQ